MSEPAIVTLTMNPALDVAADAGIAVGLSRALSIEDSVRLGIAAATAKLLTPGTSAFDRDDVESIFDTLLASPGAHV